VPELPDVELCVHALERRVCGDVLHRFLLVNPFLLRTVVLPLAAAALSHKLTDQECARLFAAAQTALRKCIERLREQSGDGFPEQVSAFRPGMAVHGRFGQPCPDCGAAVQRIVHAERETNYCARCQTGGKLLAERALSRHLREDWPRTLEEWERQ
jgi:formamidopyrimidine-DNA glycosylase